MAISEKLPRLTVFTADTLPVIQATIVKSDGSGALNLSGGSAKCLLRLIGATANKFASPNDTASIVDATNGRVDYTMPTGGLDDPGVYYGQFRLTLPGGVQRSQMFILDCRLGL